MESLEDFRQNRNVIEDFSSRTLAAIPGEFGRLYYVSSLTDAGSGRYEHDGLAALYPENAVQAALLGCHQELFSRILETPLKDQEADLRECLLAAGELRDRLLDNRDAEHSFETMCPDGLPDYLQELFCSNMEVLLAIVSSGKPSQARAA